MRLSLVVVLVALVAGSVGCAAPKKEHELRLKPPTENDESTLGNGAGKDTHFAEVKKAAAKQLDCPEEKINIVCLRRDSDGECISIRADGCDKSFEYQFGDT